MGSEGFFSPKSENRRISIMAVLQDKMSNSKILDEQRELCGNHLSLASCVRVIWHCFPGAGTPPLSLKVSALPGSLFLATQSSFQLWEFLLSATVQQLLNSTFSAVLAVSGILLFSSNRATHFRGGDHLTDSPSAVLILGKLLWGYICCKRCQALCFFVQLGEYIPNSSRILSPVKRLLCKFVFEFVAEFDHW